MTIEKVESLYSQLEQVMIEHDEIELVADRVQNCDTASLQLILNFQRASQKDGHTVRWRNPTAAVTNVAELLGMTQILNLDQIEQ